MAENDARVRITTSSFTLFNEDGIMLKLAYLDESLSISIGSSVTSNGKRTYPKDKRESFIITSDRASALYDIITEKAVPAMVNGENYDGAVLLSKRKDSMFQIAVENGSFIGSYFKEIDESRRPKSTFAYKFPTVQVIENYDPNDPSQFKSREIHAQFLLFVKYVEAFVLMGTNASTHSYRVANRYFTDNMMKLLKDMAVKMGVSIDTYHSYSQNPNTGFDEQAPFGNDSMMPSIEEVNSLSGML